MGSGGGLDGLSVDGILSLGTRGGGIIARSKSALLPSSGTAARLFPLTSIRAASLGVNVLPREFSLDLRFSPEPSKRIADKRFDNVTTGGGGGSVEAVANGDGDRTAAGQELVACSPELVGSNGPCVLESPIVLRIGHLYFLMSASKTLQSM